MPAELPRHTRAERRDKIRNRAKVLAAAADVFARKGVEHTTVDEIAAEAGVGVGTLYRGFGDKGGLVAAILDERERVLQDALLTGPAPLGPGAPPGARIRAFLEALSGLVESSYELLLVSENHTPGARYRIGSYGAWRLHLASLLGEIRTHGLLGEVGTHELPGKVGTHEPPGEVSTDEKQAGAALLADCLLAPLAADLYRHQRRELGISAERIRETVVGLAQAVVGRET